MVSALSPLIAPESTSEPGVLERRYGSPVRYDSSMAPCPSSTLPSNACVLATVWCEHADACRNLVVVTVSEGIGTGILLNGQLVRGANGMAGEFGHVPLDPQGPVCGCGGRGCWEVYASNRAALRYYLESGSTTDGM